MKDDIRGEERTQSPMSKQTLASDSSDDDFDPFEYGDTHVKPRKNERCSRQSAQEAAKKLKKNFAESSGDEDDE